MLDIETIEQTENAQMETNGKFLILCKCCRFHLTSSDFSLSMRGTMNIYCVYPQGLIFVFKYFSKVPGSLINGKLTFEHSWFPGYA